MPEESKDDKSKKNQPWTSEDVVAFLKAIEPYAGKYLQFAREKAESEHKFARLGAMHDWRIAWVSFVFLGVLVALMSWLTSVGKVSGMPCSFWLELSPATSSA